jgi:hypothetical protein
MGSSTASKLRPSAPLFFRRIICRSAVASLQIIAISFLFRTAAAQTPVPVPAQAPALASSQVPVITFDQKSFDFGKIQHGQTVVHHFTVSNTGNATLHIKAVHANCGCTSTVVGKMVLEPGESTEIEARYTPEDGFSGAVRKTIMVVSDAPTHSKATLRFSADVIPDPPSSKPAQ